MNMDKQELREEREKKQTRQIITKIVTALFIIAVIAVAFFTRNTWMPMVQKAFHSMITGEKEITAAPDGESPQNDNFPIKIQGGMGYQLLAMDGALALLDESRFYVYDTNGRLMNQTQHTYSNPILCVSDTKALIYDVGGKSYRLESKYKTIYEHDADDVIYLARLSDKDYVGIVTRSDFYLSQLKVLDEKGEKAFTLQSYDGRIIDIEFNKDSTGCIITLLYAKGGELLSRMVCYDFTKKEPVWEAQPVDTLTMDVKMYSNGTIAMIGDTVYALFDSNGNLLSKYAYEEPITDYASSGEMSVIITENTELRKTNMVIFSPGRDPKPIPLVHGEKDVCISSNMCSILSDEKIYLYSAGGTDSGYYNARDQFDHIVQAGRLYYLLGYDQISLFDPDNETLYTE